MPTKNDHVSFEDLPDSTPFMARGGNIFVKAVAGNEQRGYVGNNRPNAITMNGNNVSTAHFPDPAQVIPYDETKHGQRRIVDFLQGILVTS